MTELIESISCSGGTKVGFQLFTSKEHREKISKQKEAEEIERKGEG